MYFDIIQDNFLKSNHRLSKKITLNNKQYEGYLEKKAKIKSCNGKQYNNIIIKRFLLKNKFIFQL